MAPMATERILLVEDESLIAKDLERRLQRMGYLVIVLAVTGLDAIHQTLEHQPDVVLMDIRLQGQMDGIEAAAQYGIAAVVQPGGSIRDAEVIEAVDKMGLVMLFTNTRHFRH